MDGDTSDGDDMGIRVSGNTLFYSAGNSSAWTGSSLINKPIGDFLTGTFDRSLGSGFAVNNAGSIQGVVNSHIIPEPEEYAIVFGLFALAFVFVRCRMMQMKHP